MSCASVSSCLCQLAFCPPSLFFESGVQFITWYGSLFLFIECNFLHQLSLFTDRISLIFAHLHCLRKLSAVTCSARAVPVILLSTLFWKLSRSCFCLVRTVQVSAPYSNVLRTRDWYRRFFVVMEMLWAIQMCCSWVTLCCSWALYHYPS